MKLIIPLIFLSLSAFATYPSKNDKDYYNEKYRPQYHFTPEKNWMNDPNGLVYYNGEYHLFYQHNPFGKEWGYMHWGHAVSKDLLHWEHLPLAITPDDESKDKSHATAFSGSAIVDENNVTGLQKGENKTLLIFYTSFENGQRMAYSNDCGRTWKKYEKNPIIPFSKDDARDPKVFYHKATSTFVMVLYRKPEGDDARKGISIYTSKNLIDWQLSSHVKGFFECPDLFELPVNGDPSKTKWVMVGGDGSYAVGTFNGKQFLPEQPIRMMDFGKNFYATQTWSNQPEGKVIQLAWMKGGEYPEMPFNGQMNFPCELSLKSVADGIILCRKPIDALANIQGKAYSKKEKNIIPGIQGNLLSGISGDALRIVMLCDPKNADGFGFMIRNGKKENGTEIRYDAKKKTLDVLGTEMNIEPVNGKFKFDILVDRSSIEIFVNDGMGVMSNCFIPADRAEDLTLWTQGGELYIDQLDVYPIKTIWRTK